MAISELLKTYEGRAFLAELLGISIEEVMEILKNPELAQPETTKTSQA